jgi:hypothetical protein
MVDADPDIGALLAGESPLPWQTPRLRMLAQALPRRAEEARVKGSVASGWAWSNLRLRRWGEVLERAVEREPGWVELAAACVAVAEVLAGACFEDRWPELHRRPQLSGNEEAASWKGVLSRVEPSLVYATDLASNAEAELAFRRLRRPRVHALLRGAPSARVYMLDAATRPPMEPDGADDVRELLRSWFPGLANPCWMVEVPTVGRSAMAAMFVRATAEADPDAMLGSTDVGITGELTVDGSVRRVESLVEKVTAFFERFPDGTCFVPSVQADELDGLRPPPTSFREMLYRSKPRPSLTNDQWRRIVRFQSVRHLLWLLQVGDRTDEALRVLRRVGEQSVSVVDWRGETRAVSRLASLPMTTAVTPKRRRKLAESLFDDHADRDLTVESVARAPWGGDEIEGTARRVVITGRPGSGKSMVLRQLHHALNVGEARLCGPSLFVAARRLGASGSLAAALQQQVGGGLESAHRLLSSSDLAGACWLLIDGLDELPAHDRLMVTTLVGQWPGPAVIATRGLPEQLPSGLLVRVEDLEPYRVRQVLDAEGADMSFALAESAGPFDKFLDRLHRGPRRASPVDPADQIGGDLATTPLGLSVLGMVGVGASAARQRVLRDAMLHLVRRGAAAGRLSEGAAKRFERHGVTQIGAAAWLMLRAQRAILDAEDIAVAERALGLSFADGDLMHEIVEHGVFVQPVGVGRWEFSHKSFAEFAAGVWLAGRERSGDGWHAAVSRLGEPGVREVLVHLAALLAEPAPLIDAVLSVPGKQLSAQRLVTRMFIDMEPGRAPVDVLVRVLVARLRLWSRFRHLRLPGGIEGLDDVKHAIERHREHLIDYVDVLLNACPPAVRRWATAPAEEARRMEADRQAAHTAGRYGWDDDWRAHDRVTELASWFSRTFQLRHDLRDLLSDEQGVALLRARGPGAWTRDLRALFGEPAVGHAAEELWWELRSDAELLDHVTDLRPDHPHLARVLAAVARRGSLGQRREAVLRVVVPSGARLGGGALVGDISELPPDDVLALWDPAVRAGVVGGVVPRMPHGADARVKLEDVLAAFVDDQEPAVRWRAVVALRAVAGGRSSWSGERKSVALHPGIVATLRRLLSDASTYVRAEALALLADGHIQLTWDELLPLLIASGPEVRLIGLRASLAGRELASSEVLVRVLATLPPPPERSWSDGPSAELPWTLSVREHAQRAREVLVEAVRGLFVSWSGAETIFAMADEPGLGVVVSSILGGGAFGQRVNIPATVLRRALASSSVAAKRWGAGRLGWRTTSSVPSDLLENLVADPDPEVAEAAMRQVRANRGEHGAASTFAARQEPEESAPQSATEPATLDEMALHLPMMGERRGKTITLNALSATTTFEEAWELLGKAALRTKSAQEMDGYYSEDGPEFIVMLAEQAADRNREQVRAAFEHLRGLYQYKFRNTLIDNLGHPSRGLFARLLLEMEPRSRDLLRAVRHNEVAAGRVADLAAGTTLSLAVVDAVLAAVLDGDIKLPPPDPSPSMWFVTEPVVLKTLRRAGGDEALVELLVRANSHEITENVLRALVGATDNASVDSMTHRTMRRSRPGNRPMSDGAREQGRQWALRHLGDPHRHLDALHLLAIMGTPEDASQWRVALQSGMVPPTEMAVAARIVGRTGGDDDLVWLRELTMRTSHLGVVGEVMATLAARGRADDARWAFERLDDPPPAVDAAVARRDDSDRRREAMQEAARAAGDPNWFLAGEDDPELGPRFVDTTSWQHDVHLAVVRHGDDALGLELAWRLAESHDGLQLCKDEGRLPSHALLVLGAIHHDPGEQVIPAGVTGGGDEVEESGVPDAVRSAVDRIVDVTSQDEVRRVFLEAILRGYDSEWGGGNSYGLVGTLFFELGGPQPADCDRLLAQLRVQPANGVALSLLADIGRGEAELLDIWRKRGVPWLA